MSETASSLQTVGPNLSPEQPDIAARRRPSQDQHFEIRRVANLLTAVREIMGWQLLSSVAVSLGGEQIKLTLTRSRRRWFFLRVSGEAPRHWGSECSQRSGKKKSSQKDDQRISTVAVIPIQLAWQIVSTFLEAVEYHEGLPGSLVTSR